ncbi:hypothetical protein KIN20_027439 [Parelaphostrongylus tenuis]|uniref:RING-type domain-containing protein n=1 Tax=Parelaphostrongylus tenuis TaxID=148309 RepID=A0AAD5WDV8_PARTN|nr:hypothetical protein KIN20_027439 [Parelaphostrongylus tenuis]
MTRRAVVGPPFSLRAIKIVHDTVLCHSSKGRNPYPVGNGVDSRRVAPELAWRSAQSTLQKEHVVFIVEPFLVDALPKPSQNKDFSGENDAADCNAIVDETLCSLFSDLFNPHINFDLEFSRSMLSCGHSFCSGCIQNWLSESVSCPTCRTGTQLPIRNIALEQVVEEFRQSRQNRSRSARSSAACEEESSSASLSRQRSLGDSRRSRFIVEGPVVIVDGPGSSSGALENEIRCPGSRTSDSVEASPSGNFSRASFFRRSVCAIRKSIGRRSKKKDMNGTSEDRASVCNQPRLSTFDEKVTETGSHCEEMSSTKRFTWKKLFPFKLKKVHPFRSDKKCAVATCGPVCVYSGFGRTFERINPGEEIAIIVFGRRGVGKTSLLDNATLSCEGRHGIAPLRPHRTDAPGRKAKPHGVPVRAHDQHNCADTSATFRH